MWDLGAQGGNAKARARNNARGGNTARATRAWQAYPPKLWNIVKYRVEEMRPKWPFWKHRAPKMHLVEAQCAHRKHCYPETPLGSDPTSQVLQKLQKNSRRLWRSQKRNPAAFPKAGPIFQQPFSLPEKAQTLAGTAFGAAGKSMNNFPAASRNLHQTLSGKEFWTATAFSSFLKNLHCVGERLRGNTTRGNRTESFRGRKICLREGLREDLRKPPRGPINYVDLHY